MAHQDSRFYNCLVVTKPGPDFPGIIQCGLYGGQRSMRQIWWARRDLNPQSCKEHDFESCAYTSSATRPLRNGRGYRRTVYYNYICKTSIGLIVDAEH